MSELQCVPSSLLVSCSIMIPEPEVDLNFFTNNETKKSGDTVREVQIQVHQQWNSHLQINANGPKYQKDGTVAFGNEVESRF